jgi:hypothetical protein
MLLACLKMWLLNKCPPVGLLGTHATIHIPVDRERASEGMEGEESERLIGRRGEESESGEREWRALIFFASATPHYIFFHMLFPLKNLCFSRVVLLPARFAPHFSETNMVDQGSPGVNF